VGTEQRLDTGSVSQIEPKTCILRLAPGVVEPCPGKRCAFWEPGGAVVEGGCLIERLGVNVRQADLAQYLLETRQRLAQGRDTSEAEAAHREFSHRIGL
jgi:hypothetical protein